MMILYAILSLVFQMRAPTVELDSEHRKVTPFHFSGKSTTLVYLCIHVFLKARVVWQPGEDCCLLAHSVSG